MAQLPNTGEESNVAATAALGLLATASGLALAAKRKKLRNNIPTTYP